MTRKENKSHFYLTIIIVLLAFLGTRLHEGLHYVIGYVNGWNPTSTSGLLSGFTEVSMQTMPSAISLWTFYMLPPVVLYLLVMIVTIYHPDRFMRVIGIVIVGMNLPSFSLELSGSDSYNAMQVLITSSMNSLTANLIHWGIYLLAIAIYIIYIYIVIEDDNSDVLKRIKTIRG